MGRGGFGRTQLMSGGPPGGPPGPSGPGGPPPSGGPPGSDPPGSAGGPAEGETEIYRFPEFFERLRSQGALDVRDAVQSETEIDGTIYHHRGVQVPGYTTMVVWEPPASRSVPAFTVEVGTVGPRKAWATFDATREWDVYLVLFEKGAVVAWMTDAEFDAEEADLFASKAAAIQSGRFSFGVLFQFGPDWVEKESWGEQSSAPALIQLGDGRLLKPMTESEFHANVAAIPIELRDGFDGEPPDHLGLLDVGLSTES